ncbi:MAG: hypothetical protein O9318_00860 [Hylemonella sp.]|uniref:hypothetical protein n=1 Tax=Hylemonella sp. TaxID=2066020 RepID=UPI0022C16EE5|nr:hypothetical protein [Hylemonella sp.]MCZ8250998.1 hypothetical protein [Hylemonella sp.]
MRTRVSTPALLLSLPLLLGGCAALNDATMRALATPAPALAVIGERVLTGEVLLYTDRSATLQLQSQGEPALSCMGSMRYTSSTGGVVNLRCSDGRQARLAYTALGETSGHGAGRDETHSVSLTYGLAPEAARAWLIAPPGKRLVPDGGSLRLE